MRNPFKGYDPVMIWLMTFMLISVVIISAPFVIAMYRNLLGSCK